MGSPSAPTSLLSSLTEALQENTCAVRPLDEAHYVDAHRAFEQASTQQPQIRNVIEAEAQRLLQNGHNGLDVLSVGCGCGMLDAPLLAHLGPHVDSFTGIDPNAAALDQCRRALGGTAGPSDCRFECTPLENFESDRRYDLIYCSHVLYYVDAPAAVLDTMRALRRDTGTLVIAHAPKDRLNMLAQAFWPSQGPDDDFYAPALRRLLSRNGRPAPTERQIDADLPRALFDDTTPQGTLLLEFLIQAQWAPLSAEVKTHVADYLDRSARATSPQGLLSHPVTTFALRGTSDGS
jgi:2-polyprenyl-3-methyl-5-hydroxy-6-metoxy-1,4-benzoquinol methylase